MNHLIRNKHENGFKSIVSVCKNSDHDTKPLFIVTLIVSPFTGITNDEDQQIRQRLALMRVVYDQILREDSKKQIGFSSLSVGQFLVYTKNEDFAIELYERLDHLLIIHKLSQ